MVWTIKKKTWQGRGCVFQGQLNLISNDCKMRNNTFVNTSLIIQLWDHLCEHMRIRAVSLFFPRLCMISIGCCTCCVVSCRFSSGGVGVFSLIPDGPGCWRCMILCATDQSWCRMAAVHVLGGSGGDATPQHHCWSVCFGETRSMPLVAIARSPPRWSGCIPSSLWGAVYRPLYAGVERRVLCVLTAEMVGPLVF